MIDTFSIGSAIIYSPEDILYILFPDYIQPLGFGKPAILAAFFAGPLGNN